MSMKSIIAENVTSDIIKVVANNFYIEHFDSNYDADISAIDEIISVKKQSTDLIYYVNYKNGGWVAISATDAVRPILAYSYTGTYVGDNQPENFKAWVSQYENQIYYSINNNLKGDNKIKEMWHYYTASNSYKLRDFEVKTEVEPLLISKWNQGKYYNEMCPEDSGPGGHCYAGCVPAAMGQICNYFGFPESGLGSYSYECPPYGTLSADFENTTYNFNWMPISVNTNSVETAQLLYHLGVSCDLDYGPDGSGMYNHKAAYALRTHFKYDPTTQYLYRDSTTMDWDSVMVNHLDRKIPLYYAGWSVPDIVGHAFVCDGYQDSTYYHFNWGWGGSNDGYFYIDNLSPGGSNFNLAQELVINCFPDTANYQYPYYCSGNDTITSLSAGISDGSGPVNDYLNNQVCTWFINPVDSVNNITIEFVKFDLLDGDSLFVYDGSDASYPLLGSYSGSAIPESVTSSSDKLFVRFATDNIDVSKGWYINYTCEMPVFCGSNFLTDFYDTISDGSGVANYQNMTSCLWVIQSPDLLPIDLDFIDFSTEADHDFVTIYDAEGELGNFSGNNLPDHITAYGGLMTLMFSTNLSVTSTGWTAIYSMGVPVEENKGLQTFMVYPVPANNLINIKGSFDGKAELFSLQGVKVGEAIIENGETTMSVVNCVAGTYILKIISGEESLTKKVTIQH